MSKKSDTSQLTCPGCWILGPLDEVLPATPLGGQAWYQCKRCSWAGPSSAVTRGYVEPSVNRQIKECLAEDADRGTPGSSGGSKGRTGKVPKGTPNGPWDTGIKSASEPIGQPRTKVLRWGKWTLRVTDLEFEVLLRVAGGRYPAGLKQHVLRVVGREPENVTQVLDAFRTLVLEFLSQAS